MTPEEEGELWSNVFVSISADASAGVAAEGQQANDGERAAAHVSKFAPACDTATIPEYRATDELDPSIQSNPIVIKVVLNERLYCFA